MADERLGTTVIENELVEIALKALAEELLMPPDMITTATVCPTLIPPPKTLRDERPDGVAVKELPQVGALADGPKVPVFMMRYVEEDTWLFVRVVKIT